MSCPIVRFNALVGGKYKLRILWELRAAPRRYSEIQRAIGAALGGRPITPRVLSRELRELGDAGLISRKQYPVIPPRVEYRLTRDGQALDAVLRSICRWGAAAPIARRGVSGAAASREAAAVGQTRRARQPARAARARLSGES